MNDVVFVTSHLGSGSEILLDTLNAHPRIDIQNLKAVYAHPTDLETLVEKGHKLDNAAAIYGDHIIGNAQFTCKPLLKFCHFVFLVREPTCTINSILELKELPDLKSAISYYELRLRRLYEIARKAEKAVFLTWEQMASDRALSMVEDMLGLKSPLHPAELSPCTSDYVPFDVSEKEQDFYEKYLYFFRGIDHLRML